MDEQEELIQILLSLPLHLMVSIEEEMLEHAKTCENCKWLIPILEKNIEKHKVGS